MVFVAKNPVDGLYAFDMPLVCDTILSLLQIAFAVLAKLLYALVVLRQFNGPFSMSGVLINLYIMNHWIACLTICQIAFINTNMLISENVGFVISVYQIISRDT
jgi:hypothetical protein